MKTKLTDGYKMVWAAAFATEGYYSLGQAHRTLCKAAYNSGDIELWDALCAIDAEQIARLVLSDGEDEQ